MISWSRVTTPVVIASPLATTFLICAVFVLWFGLSAARSVEATEIDRRTETLSLIVSYVQHLIDDSRWNAENLENMLADLPAPPSNQQLSELRARARSDSHIRSVAFLDGRGTILSYAGDITPHLADRLSSIATNLQGAGGQLFLPDLEALRDEADIPDFIFAKAMKKGPAAVVIFDMSVKPSNRPTSFNVANDSAAATVFGHHANGEPNWIARVRSSLAGRTLPQDMATHVRCEGNVITARQCVVYRRLANSSLAFAGLIESQKLKAAWVQANRPIWIFAAVFLIGGASSSACIGVWVRQRRRDRAALAETVDKLQQAYAAKSNFMAHMSHELRTPLNSIIGFSDLLRGEILGPLSERYRSYAEDIHFSATHFHRVVSEILDIERLEQSKQHLEPSEADLNVVAADAVRMLAVIAAEKGVMLEADPSSQPAIVDMDPHRAAQIGVNLVSNAVKYSEPGDRVNVTVKQMPEGNFALVVTDEGIGMTAAEIAYTAQPFGQPADRRSTRHDSVGLGLPIVRGLLAAAGGHLHISSEKDKGTKVSAVFGRGAEMM